MARCLRIHPADNVATMLQDANAERVDVLGAAAGAAIELREPVALGHKVALTPIVANHPVVKYGVTIGIASKDISAGEWVHLQNCRSRVDVRSQSLDPRTGAPVDNPYE
jgi:altronate dehydratase small subunit